MPASFKRHRGNSDHSEVVLDDSDGMGVANTIACISCRRPSVPVDFRGPDGNRTLCCMCYRRYRECKIRLYRLKGGKITANKGSGGRPVLMTGFQAMTDGSGKDDLGQPKVRTCTRNEFNNLPEGLKRRRLDLTKKWISERDLGNREVEECRERSGDENSGVDCLACSAYSKQRETGPDGIATLCQQCAVKYRNLKLRLYRLEGGRITAAPSPRGELVAAVGFKRYGSNCDWERPRVRAVSRTQHSAMVGVAPCFCCRKEVDSLITGPDGYKTLCFSCGGRYYRMEMCVFKKGDGSVTVVGGRERKRAIVVGFEESDATLPGKFDLRFPIVRDARVGEHAKFHSGIHDICGARRAEDVEENDKDDDEGEREGDRMAYMERENGGNQVAPSKRFTNDTDVVENELDEEVCRERVATKILERHNTRRDKTLSFVVKATCSYGWETKWRYIYMAYGVKVSSFTQVLKETFRMDTPFSICYEDGDGDLIHVADESDMLPMFEHARVRQGALPVQMRPPG